MFQLLTVTSRAALPHTPQSTLTMASCSTSSGGRPTLTPAAAMATAAAQPRVDTGPVAELMVDSVAATLKSGGTGAVRELVPAAPTQTLLQHLREVSDD